MKAVFALLLGLITCTLTLSHTIDPLQDHATSTPTSILSHFPPLPPQTIHQTVKSIYKHKLVENNIECTPLQGGNYAECNASCNVGNHNCYYGTGATSSGQINYILPNTYAGDENKSVDYIYIYDQGNIKPIDINIHKNKMLHIYNNIQVHLNQEDNNSHIHYEQDQDYNLISSHSTLSSHFPINNDQSNPNIKDTSSTISYNYSHSSSPIVYDTSHLHYQPHTPTPFHRRSINIHENKNIYNNKHNNINKNINKNNNKNKYKNNNNKNKSNNTYYTQDQNISPHNNNKSFHQYKYNDNKYNTINIEPTHQTPKFKMIPSNKIIKGNESGIIIKNLSIDHHQQTNLQSIQPFIYIHKDTDTPNLPTNNSTYRTLNHISPHLPSPNQSTTFQSSQSLQLPPRNPHIAPVPNNITPNKSKHTIHQQSLNSHTYNTFNNNNTLSIDTLSVNTSSSSYNIHNILNNLENNNIQLYTSESHKIMNNINEILLYNRDRNRGRDRNRDRDRDRGRDRDMCRDRNRDRDKTTSFSCI